MSAVAKIRSVAFACGIVGVMVSISLVVGSFIRHVDTTNYIKQAEEGVPWVDSGLVSAFAGFVFCLMGRRWWRVAGVTLALLLLIWWFLIAESLF
jgi:hypothetical protein